MHDLAGRLAHRIQLTTDGHRVYADAVESAFGSEIDYAMLVKIYGADRTESEALAPPNARDAAPSPSAEIQKRGIFRLALLSVRISRCVCRCGALRG